jgi:hypothetical protein
MHWPTPPYAQSRNIRARYIFALVPRRCEDGRTHWLEKVLVIEARSKDPLYQVWEEIRSYPGIVKTGPHGMNFVSIKWPGGESFETIGASYEST